ncbi:hypothetical protein [Paenibacillus mucilaginosus]|uniref:Uncharacterized protein n=2 Tax=Paenibacillus mucilaginosus TaxID=61624 RepID=I0BTD1_9BACL|nr:hypothetical protein [Paenibacillus mucilaginosus]AEI45641.1 hypothetical protein KNP414_07131 [Paenibacillus mucilaginosus KNP414]AFH65628.1 hypothetical protein B2K_33855 [Paenibacillus mucilaginosus K02]MCG7215161.1 hypothetical protein [Paenibacillus mucilaginosus]WDM27042.1 hypothetical protein KCX80_32355 [Paenibacillus mucilaginosus]
MKTNLSMEQVYNIAETYKEKYKLSGTIDTAAERTISKYDGFDGINGKAWLVLVSIVPTKYEADNQYTIVISDEKRVVEYIIDANGHYFSPHSKGGSGMTDEEFDAIWDDDTEE